MWMKLSKLQDSRNEEKFVGVNPPKAQVVLEEEQRFSDEVQESNVVDSTS